MHFPTSFYSISSRAPSSLLVLIFEKRYETIEDLCSGQRLETTKKKKAFKRSRSTPSDVLIETLMICTYCREKYLSDNQNKDPETFVPSTNKFNKNLFIHGTISYYGENSHLESKSKKTTNHYRSVQWTKNLWRCSIKKVTLKVSEHSQVFCCKL